MSQEPVIYRKVLDDFSDEVIGIVMITHKCQNHFVIDNYGYRRKTYRYNTISEEEYNDCIAFDLFPKLKIINLSRYSWFQKNDTFLSFLALFLIIGYVVFGLFLGIGITWGDLAPVLKSSLMFQGVFFGLLLSTICFIILSIVHMVASSYLDAPTKRDDVISRWREYLKEDVYMENERIHMETWIKQERKRKRDYMNSLKKRGPNSPLF